MKRTHWQRLAVALVAPILAATGVLHNVATADAAPRPGCEVIRWGFLGSQLRTICDSERRPDGSWERARRVWVPAGYVRGSGYCGSYSCTYNEGYYREESTVAFETYVVFDHNVVPGEPAWLPPGTFALR